MIQWPDLTFPPINLWNAPRLQARPEKRKADTPRPARREPGVSRLDTIRQLMARR